ncbi:uncharacterized protein LOC124416253 [Diprion similis]|uniref:uncharacterized protein LOC124416253 n=1 Tax=Diprion similis TaxID=362088 RepID=UPI001EF764E5|nr:uncharacterized protein LOC124416253 [Diprion similis]
MTMSSGSRVSSLLGGCPRTHGLATPRPVISPPGGMQLLLIRFYLIVLLFVSLIDVEAVKELSRFTALTPNPAPMPAVQQVSSSWANDEHTSGVSYRQSGSKLSNINGGAVRINRNIKRKRRHRAMGKVLDGKSVHKTFVPGPNSSAKFLAEKLAQEALDSKEMQDTIKHLTSLEGGRQQHKVSRSTTARSKDQQKRKDREHRKRMRHRKGDRKHRHPNHRLKRNGSKKESSKTMRLKKNSKLINEGKLSGFGKKSSLQKSHNRRRRRGHRTGKKTKNFGKTSGDNLRSVNNDDWNTIEELTNSGAVHGKYTNIAVPRQTGNERGVVPRSDMIARLMLTTTRDPTKKKPGDQGIEYSEYYNDNENASPMEIGSPTKLDEASGDLAEGQSRSIREIADDNLLHHQDYDDSLDDEVSSEDVDRSKRNDQKSVKVIEDPLNSMEYVDSTYGSLHVDGVAENERMPPYLVNYNYIPNEGVQMPVRALQIPYHPPSNPSAGPSGVGQPMANQFSSDEQDSRNKNFLIPTVNPISFVSNAQLAASGQLGILDNDALSQMPQPNFAEGEQFAASTVSRSSRSSTDPVTFTSGLATLGGSTSVAPEPKLRMTPVSVGTNAVASRLRSVGTAVDAPEVAYLSYHDGGEDIQGLDQIEAAASRKVVPKNGTAEKNISRDTSSTKVDTHSSAASTQSHLNDPKNNSNSNADTDVSNVVLPATSSPASFTPKPCTPEPGNVTLKANETKAVASQILNEIIDELEELKLENPKDERKEGLPCRLTGSWVTTRAGVRIDMEVTNHSVRASLDHLTPPPISEGLLNVTWNVTGFAPFQRGGPFTLLATDNHTKTLAVFVGACKVCQGIDTIEGSWTVSREPRDCRDFQMSSSIFNEMFRRTRLFSAIKEKQVQHDAASLNTTATPGNNSSLSQSTSPRHEGLADFSKLHNQTTPSVNGSK